MHLSLKTLSICDTPTKLLKHFISRIFTFLLSAHLIPHVSALYNTFGTITTSHRHFFLCIYPNPLMRSTLFSIPHALYKPFILCTTYISHPPSAPTYDRRYLNWSHHVSHAFIRPLFPYLEHLITLLLPTFNLNFLLLHTLPNSLTSLPNFSSELATSAVSSENNS